MCDLKRYSEAVVHLDCAIKIKPSFAIAFYNKGRACEMQGKLRLAIENYSKALVLDGKLMLAYSNLTGLAVQLCGPLKSFVRVH